jgi:hypothetical protein
MRSKLIAFMVGCGLAAIVAPALACDYHNTTAQNGHASEQTAQTQQSTDVSSN